MRKIYRSMMLIAAAAMAFASCQKQEPAGETDRPVVKMSVIASIDDDDTKTQIRAYGPNYNAYWSEGDKIKVIETIDGAISQTADSNPVFVEGRTQTFSVTLDENSGSAFTYTAVYPTTAYSTGGSGDNTFRRVKLLDAQTLKKGSFAGESDLLIGEARSFEAQPTSLKLNFHRVGATARMNLESIPAGELITKVEVSTTEGNLVGYMKFDETTGTIIPGEDGSFVYSGSKKITLTPTEDFAVSEITEIFFRLAPIKLVKDFTVKVTTDKAVYNKTIDLAGAAKEIEFRDGCMTRFVVDLTGCREAISSTAYLLVTDASSLSEGDIIRIGLASKGKAAGVKSGDFLSSVDATFTAGKMISNEAVDFTLGGTAAGWTLTSSAGVLGATAAKKLSYEEGTTTWTISIEDSGAATIASTESSYGRFLYNTSSPRFLNYTSSTSTSMILPEIYRFDDGKIPLESPSASAYVLEDAPTIHVSWYAVDHAVKYIVSCTGQEDQEVSASTLVAGFYDLPAGTYSVTVTAVGGEGYRNSSSTVSNLVVTVHDPDALSTMDQIFQAATDAGSTATDVNVTFNNWVVSGANSNNVYVTDGAKGFIIYASSNGFEAGDVLSGTVGCRVQLYNGSAELTGVTASTVGLTVTKGGTLTPQVVSISDLSGVNTGALVSLGLLSYDGANFSDGTNTIKPYTTLYSYSLISGKNYAVTGVYLQYNTTKEILPRSADDLVMEVTTEPELLEVGPTSLTFDADNDGDDYKTVSITGFNLTTSNVALSVSNGYFAATFDGDDAYKVKVCATSANTSTTAEKTATLTITVGSVSKTVELKQSKAGVTIPDPVVLSFPDDNSANNKVSNYTTKWTAKKGEYSWTITNFNNNNWGWTYIKCGRKNYDSVGTIATDAPFAAAVTTLIFNYSSMTKGNVNSITLTVATDSAFSQNVQTVTGDASTASGGKMEFEVPTPTANCYYKMTFDCSSASSNGVVTLTSLEYKFD